MQKIVITGSNGLLGQTLVNLLLMEPQKYNVFGLSRGENRSERNDFDYRSIDITNKAQLSKCLYEIRPDVIVNTAAMTQVDLCEDHKETCDLLNIDAVQYLVDISKDLGAYLVHLSTDFIFDGIQGNYKETDTPNPISYYGLSKLKAEEVLLNSSIDFSILRTILVYGKVNNLGRNNIVLWVVDMLSQGKEINIVDDQFRMPTYVEDLAMACKISIDKRAKGIFHISSSRLLSVFEIARTIAEVFELNKNLVKAISSDTLNQRANRPPKTGFDLTKTRKVLDFHPKTFKEDLHRFKESLT